MLLSKKTKLLKYYLYGKLNRYNGTLPNMHICGSYNPLHMQLIYDENGNILKYIQKPTEICAHDVDYTLSKNLNDKHIADQKIIDSINKLPYNQRQWGTFFVRISFLQNRN